MEDEVTPANDNSWPLVIPIFHELLLRHDLTRLDCLVYGAMVAFSDYGFVVTSKELGRYLGMPKQNLSSHILNLENAGLIARFGIAGRNRSRRIELLGPKIGHKNGNPTHR